MSRCLAAVILLVASNFSLGDDTPAKPQAAAHKPKDALQPFNELIGSWKATGAPEGSQAVKQKGFWTETVAWAWKFKGDDAWLTVAFTKGNKYFENGTLHYLPEKDLYRLSLQTNDKQTLDFEGKLDEKKRNLTLDRTDDKKKESQRFVLTMLHETRFLYRYEVKPESRASFTIQYKVGGTKEGVAFASGTTGPECIVSGGLGTITVTYKGKDYYVCCTGCRDAFMEEPEKYIKEFEAKKNKK